MVPLAQSVDFAVEPFDPFPISTLHGSPMRLKKKLTGIFLC